MRPYDEGVDLRVGMRMKAERNTSVTVAPKWCLTAWPRKGDQVRLTEQAVLGRRGDLPSASGTETWNSRKGGTAEPRPRPAEIVSLRAGRLRSGQGYGRTCR